MLNTRKAWLDLILFRVVKIKLRVKIRIAPWRCCMVAGANSDRTYGHRIGQLQSLNVL